MRRLTPTGARRRHRTHAERGAVATIVAVLFAGLAFMGLLAVSVDLGNLAYERRQVQNAADATSLALAQECAGGAPGKAICVPATVADLLDANAHDGAHRYDVRNDAPAGACARGTAAQVGPLASHPCSSDGAITDLRECPPLPGWLTTGEGVNIPYVETYAATETATGDTELFLPFSRVLAGGASGDAGTTACARAAWGRPSGYSAAVPLSFSSCEWQKQMDAGGYVDDGPVGGVPGYGGAGQPAWPAAAKEVVILVHDPQDEAGDCAWNGKDTSGGFGWLDQAGDCTVDVSDDDWAHIDTGNNIPNTCKNMISGMRNTVVELPVFDCIVAASSQPSGPVPTTPTDVCDPTQQQSNGNNTWYHLAGWAKFYVSGYKLGGSDSGTSSMPGGKSCSGSQRCLIGWFLAGELSDTPSSVVAPGGPNDFGTYVIKPAG